MAFIPTDANLDDALKRTVQLAKDLYDANASGADSIWQNTSDLLGNVSYPGSDRVRRGAIAFRRGIAGSIASLLKRPLDAVLLGYLLRYGSNASTPEAGWDDLLQYFQDNTKTVKQRAVTIGTPTKSSGTGTPTFRVLSTDKRSNAIESIWPVTVRMEAVAAQPESQTGQETLEFFAPPRIDLFSLEHLSDSPDPEEGGDGSRRRVVLVNSDTSLLRDTSFEFNRGLVARGALTGTGAWLDDDGASTAKIAIVDDGVRASIRERNFYNLDTTTNPEKQCIEVDGTAGGSNPGDISLSQSLRSVSRGNPYDYGVWVKRRNSATGTVKVICGSVTVTQSVGSLTNDVWTFVGVALGHMCWPDNFTVGDNLRFRVETDSIATGQVRLDAVEFGPFARINGVYIRPQPSSTPLATDYRGTWAFTIPTDSEIQKWIHFVYGEGYCLPSSGSPSITDPT